MIFQFSSDHVFLVFEFWVWVCSHDPSLVLVVGQMMTNDITILCTECIRVSSEIFDDICNC